MVLFIMLLLIAIVLMTTSPFLGFAYYRHFRNQAFLKVYFDKIRSKLCSSFVAYFSLCLSFFVSGGLLYVISSMLLYLTVDAMATDFFGLLLMI